MSSSNTSQQPQGAASTGQRLAFLGIAVAMALLQPVAASASRRGLDTLDEPAAPRASASILSLDFDPRSGATVVGITSSAAVANHTVYEPDGTTVVVEMPDVDVSRIEPSATIGTAQVESVKVETVQRGSMTLARFEIKRAPGARRAVSIDPKNPNRLELTLESGASAVAPADRAAEVAPVAPARVLAARPEPVAQPTAAPRPAQSPVQSPVVSASAPAAAAPTPRPVPVPVAAAPVPASAPRPIPEPASSASRWASAAQPAEAPAPRGPGKLTDLTVEPTTDGRTLIRLSGNRALDAEPMVLQNAPRLVIDLKNTINGLPFANLPVRDSEVLKVRVSQFEPLPDPVTRVVIDWRAEQPYRIQRGPDSLLVIIGSGDPVAPAMASNDFGAAPIGGSSFDASAPLVSGPATLANLGRPSTMSGTDLAPLPEAGAEVAASPARRGAALRETADAGGITTITPATDGKSARFSEVQVTGTEVVYTGEPISISVKDADLQDLFRLFHEVSGLNIVVDPAIKGRTITLELVEVPWDQALDLVLRTQSLGQSLEGNVLRIAPVTKLAQEEQQQKQLQEARELSGEVRQVAFPLSYASGTAAEQIVRKALSQRGDVVLDRRTNTLIVKDLADRLEQVKSLLSLLDTPTRQVMIESRIVETTLDFSKAVGIQWGFSYIADRAFGNSTGFSFPRSVAADYAVNLPVQAAVSTLGLSFRNILNTFALDIQIAALEDRGKARIISRPMVMVQNNQQAEIESGVQIPIANTTATEIEVTYVSASLKLTVQPQITADDNVVMDLKVENNAPVFIQTVGDNASISTRQAKTVVAVPNGGTTIIGGIYQVNEGVASTRVPLMSRIPLLGWLFRNKTINKTNDELLIFITPRIQKA